MARRVLVRGLSLLVVLVTVGAGCLGPPPDPHADVGRHFLVLHPPVYAWDPEAKELNGYFILSNIHKDPSRTARTDGLSLGARFFNERGEVGPYNMWDISYHAVIKPGESHVFNFTFPYQEKYRPHMRVTGNVTHIWVHMWVGYDYPDEGRPTGRGGVSSSYTNQCLVVNGGVVAQKVDEGGCDPWKWYWESPGGYHLRIGRNAYPPPEVWSGWGEESPIPLSKYPQFEPAVRFLREFDLESANVVYFQGELK